MDRSRFDALSRALVAGQSRRSLTRLLSALLVNGALGPLALGETAAKRKKRGGRKRRKKRRGTSAAPPPNPCAGQPDDAPCAGSGRCLAGTCNPQPTCAGFDVGGDCFFDRSIDCCNGCGSIGLSFQCAKGQLGGRCYTATDCANGLACIGYRCTAHQCAADQDYCADGTSTCGTSGFCLRPLDGGTSRCGVQHAADKCGCTSHAACARFGTGAFCALDTGGSCACSSGATNFCAVPS